MKNEQENEEWMKKASLGMPSLSIRHQDCLDPPKSILKIDLCGDGKQKRQSAGENRGQTAERKLIMNPSTIVWRIIENKHRAMGMEKGFERRLEGESDIRPPRIAFKNAYQIFF